MRAAAYVSVASPHYQLVCEGRCSPLFGVATATIRGRRDGRREGWDHDESIARIRAVYVHTPHVLLGFDQACCTRCGHRRRYGGNPS